MYRGSPAHSPQIALLLASQVTSPELIRPAGDEVDAFGAANTYCSAMPASMLAHLIKISAENPAINSSAYV